MKNSYKKIGLSLLIAIIAVFILVSCLSGYHPQLLIGDYESVANTKPEQISELTTLINGMNNILTTYGVIIALIALFGVIIAAINFSDMKKDVNDSVQEFRESYRAVREKIDNFQTESRQHIDNFQTKNEKAVMDFQAKNEKTITDFQTKNEENKEYISKSIDTFYLKTDKIITDLKEDVKKNLGEIDSRMEELREMASKITIDIQNNNNTNERLYKYIETQVGATMQNIYFLVEKTEDQSILEQVTKTFHKTNLYSWKEIIVIQALFYFGEQGTKADLEDIDYVIQHPLTPEIGKRASEVRGKICL